MVDRNEFRSAMARLGAAVNLITSDGPAGRRGFTASAVCSVTDDPPTLLVCVNRASESNAVLKRNGVLCVNVLAGHHAELSDRFSSRAINMDERFGDASHWLTLETGAPALADAAASFDCEIDLVQEVGTHSVLFCKVRGIRVAEDACGLIYFERAYHRLAVERVG